MQQVELPHGYKIARYTVTNAAYRRFVEAGGYHERRWWTDVGWEYLQPGGLRFSGEDERITLPRFWHDSRYNQPTQPVVGVTWYEAAAYCAWLTVQGYAQGWLPPTNTIRLPTWLEWERAARHIDKRRYPWGDVEPTIEHANYDETGISRPAPVGCFPGGTAECGAQDLAGNVLEWTATPYGRPNQPTPEKDFTLRDGVVVGRSSWVGEVEYLCCGARIWSIPYYWVSDRGFRIVTSHAFIE